MRWYRFILPRGVPAWRASVEPDGRVLVYVAECKNMPFIEMDQPTARSVSAASDGALNENIKEDGYYAAKAALLSRQYDELAEWDGLGSLLGRHDAERQSLDKEWGR